MRKRHRKPDLFIPEPCWQSWDAMAPSGPARRFCSACQCSVVDVAMLTSPELHGLIAETGADFCARVTRLPDGALLLREAPNTPTAHPFRAPVLAAVMAAGSALPIPAQGPTHTTPPALSCGEVTALKQPPGIQDRLAASPAPAPAPPSQAPRNSVTVGKMALPLVTVHGTIRLPRGRTLRSGIVLVQNARGDSQTFEMKADGSYAVSLRPGKYWLRADARADDGELYAAVDGIVLTSTPVTHDVILQGPVTVTAGAPVYVAPSSSSRKP